MAILTPQEIENVVPGSSMTKPKGMLPFERPAKTSDPKQGIQLMFDSMMTAKTTRGLVKTLEGGVPIDVVVDGLCTLALGEGLVSATALPIMAPALASIVENIAEMAGIEIKYTEEVDEWDQIDEVEVQRLADKIIRAGNNSPLEEPVIEEPVIDEPIADGLMTEMAPQVTPTEPMGLMSPPTEEGIM